MALWGNSDNVTSTGTVSLDYDTLTVTGSGTTFVTDLEVGQVLRFGIRGGGGTYFGDATISGITSATVLTIGSSMGLSGAAIASTDFSVSELPSSSTLDVKYSESSNGTEDSLVYGISRSIDSDNANHVAHQGYVGVTTYVDMHGNVRRKSEVLVAMSGITTGANGIDYPTNV
jgi:hypothetical protein